MRALEKSEHELYLMGQLSQKPFKGQAGGGDQKRVRYTYKVDDNVVCVQTFCIYNDIGHHKLKNIASHMVKHGACPRRHGNEGKQPKHALLYEDTRRVINFLVTFAAEHGLPLAAAPGGSDGTPPILLPAGMTKHSVFLKYQESCKDPRNPVRAVGLSSFKDLWLQTCPHIKFVSRRDDVCGKCETLRRRLMDAEEEEEKLKISEAFSKHITQAKEERQFYRECVDASKALMQLAGTPNSVHYTFDYAQSLLLPHHLRQMGPLYFLQLKKVHLFGVCQEGVPAHFNFLFDEGQTIGPDGSRAHGPDSVLSMLHHTLTVYNRSEDKAIIHADNCPGILFILDV